MSGVASKELIAEATRLVVAALEPMGYHEESEGVLTRRLSETPLVDGWVGLNLGTEARGGSVDVNPVVGVRDAELESVIARLLGDAGDETLPSVGVQLGYLTPEQTYRPWTFVEGAENSATAEELAATLRTYGEPFMKDMLNRAALAGAIKEHSHAGARAERLPVLHALEGDAIAARDCIGDELGTLGDDASEAGAEYRAFAERLIDWLKKEGVLSG